MKKIAKITIKRRIGDVEFIFEKIISKTNYRKINDGRITEQHLFQGLFDLVANINKEKPMICTPIPTETKKESEE